VRSGFSGAEAGQNWVRPTARPADKDAWLSDKPSDVGLHGRKGASFSRFCAIVGLATEAGARSGSAWCGDPIRGGENRESRGMWKQAFDEVPVT
jgi:hypothetical protein